MLVNGREGSVAQGKFYRSAVQHHTILTLQCILRNLLRMDLMLYSYHNKIECKNNEKNFKTVFRKHFIILKYYNYVKIEYAIGQMKILIR